MPLSGLLMPQGRGWAGFTAGANPTMYNGRALVPGMTIGPTNVKGDPGSMPIPPRQRLAQMLGRTMPNQNRVAMTGDLPRYGEGWGGEGLGGGGGYGPGNRGGYTSSGVSNYGGGYGSQYGGSGASSHYGGKTR